MANFIKVENRKMFFHDGTEVAAPADYRTNWIGSVSSNYGAVMESLDGHNWYEVEGREVSAEGDIAEEVTVWVQGSLEYCRDYKEGRTQGDKESLALINGQWWVLEIVETNHEKQETRQLDDWIRNADGETNWWRYAPSGKECPEPSLPKGYAIAGDRNGYWVVKRQN